MRYEQPSRLTRAASTVIRWLAENGISIAGTRAVRVQGRKTGKPRMVVVNEGGNTEAFCVNGVGYDLTLVLPGRSRSLHRSCEDAAVGQVADILEPVLRAALGHDPRFDVLYPGGIDYHLDRQAYQDLVAQGGRLKPDPQGRPQPPGAEIAPQVDDATPPAAAPGTAPQPRAGGPG